MLVLTAERHGEKISGSIWGRMQVVFEVLGGLISAVFLPTMSLSPHLSHLLHWTVRAFVDLKALNTDLGPKMSVFKSREEGCSRKMIWSLCPSPALCSRQLSSHSYKPYSSAAQEIRPDISQNKLYGNAFQACKTLAGKMAARSAQES